MYENGVKCIRCHYLMYNSNSQFYCCSINQRYCTICIDHQCKRCLRREKKPFQAPKCRVCYCRIQQQLLMQPKCSSYYCAKCLVTQFRSQNVNEYQLPCGHKMDISEIQNFIKGKFCIVCGKKQSISDYDLITGDRCCFQCFRWEKNKIEHLVLLCVGCQRALKRKNQIAVFNQGILLCDACHRQSQITQKEYQKLQQSQKKQQHQKNADATKINMNNNELIDLVQKNNLLIIENNKLSAHEKPIKNIPNSPYPKTQPKKDLSNEKKPDRNAQYNNYLNNSIDRQTQIKQLKSVLKHQQTQAGSEQEKAAIKTKFQRNGVNNQNKDLQIIKKEGRTVLHKFPSEREGETKSKIKKHLSMQTFVEKMKIQINIDINLKIVSCKQCEYELLQQESFTIENNMHQLDYYCRLCFTILTNSQGLGFNMMQTVLDKSRNTRGISNTRHRTPTKPQNIPTYYKPQPSDQNYLTPQYKNFNHVNSITNQIPNSPANLNPIYNTFPVPLSQPSSLSPTPMKYSGTFENYQRVSGNVQVSDPKTYYREPCQKCKATGRTLIRTSDRGSLCLQCYKRN